MPFLRSTGQTVVLSVFFGLPFHASAEQSDFTALSLKELMQLEVFTSASLLPTQQSRAPGTVYSFQRKDFDRYGVRRLEDLLAFVPGLQINQYRKRHRSVWARGLLDRYNDKMVLMVDGVRTQHLYYGHFSLGDNLPLEMIDKVEVILGPASSLYGANAFGGIISVTTRDFADSEQTELKAELADHSRAKGSLFYNSEDLQLFGSLLDQEAPFREDRKSFIGGDVLQPLDERYKSLHIKSRLAEPLTLSLSYQANNTPFLNIPTTQDAFIDENYLALALDYQAGDLDSGRIEGKLYYQDDHTREYEIEQVTRALGYEEYQNATMAGARLTYLQRFDAHTLAVGGSWQYEHAERTDFERFYSFKSGFLTPSQQGNLLRQPGITNNDVALFVQDVWELSPDLRLTLGGRYDYFDAFGGYFNYRAAAVYAPDEASVWKAQYATAIRTPTYREYLKVLEGTTFVAPSVDAEQIQSLELGYQYQWEQANVSINLFHNELEDYISEVPTPDMADEYFANSNGTTRMKGADLLLNYKPTEKMSLRFGLAYLNAESDSGDIPYLASWSGSFKLDYQLNADHNLGFSLIHLSERSDTNSYHRDEADTFVVANLFASGRLSQALSYRVGVDNLFDERVYDPAADFGSQHNNERSEREIWLSLQWDNKFL